MQANIKRVTINYIVGVKKQNNDDIIKKRRTKKMKCSNCGESLKIGMEFDANWILIDIKNPSKIAHALCNVCIQTIKIDDNNKAVDIEGFNTILKKEVK